MTHPAPSALLAIETSGSTGSVAIVHGSAGFHQVDLEGGNHARGVVPAIEEALALGGVERSALKGVVVGAGPGSFTGVRIAASTGKGIAHGLGVPMWAVSSLEAAAVNVAFPAAGLGTSLDDVAASESAPRYVLFDARGDRVYGGCFGVSSRSIETLRPSAAARIDEVMHEDLPPGVLFVGDGAWRHRARLEDNGFVVLESPAGLPSATGLLRVLELDSAREPLVDPAGWAPDYLRASSAERNIGV